MQEDVILSYLKVYLALLVLGSKAQGSSCLCHIADVPHTMPHSLQAACNIILCIQRHYALYIAAAENCHHVSDASHMQSSVHLISKSTSVYWDTTLYNIAGQGRPMQGRAGQGRAMQGRAGQGRAGQGGAGQGWAGQGRADQGRADRAR